MKATQVKRQQKGESDRTLNNRPCTVCGAVTLPYGYVAHGKGQVCSRACDDTYNQKEKQRVFSPRRSE
jgi:hypothetical protein